MHRRTAFGIEHASMGDLGVNQPVIPAFHALFHCCFHPGQGLWQQGLFPWTGLQLQAGKAIGSRFERLEKLLHGPALAPFSEHV